MPVNPEAAGFGVYIHWPFCASKCPYCDFNSHVRHGGVDEARFLAAFEREIATTAARIGPRAVSSIFLGGGTPSLMQPATVSGILDAIAAAWSVTPDAEITLEANPNSVEAARFAGYRSAGVNRVSIGVQSLREPDLKALGRLHSVDEAKAAIAIAARTFERFSFDLIYARPGQTPDDWAAELNEALSLQAGHLSLYQLTLEPGTPFTRLAGEGKLRLPEDSLADDLFALTQDLTAASGLPAYEISNHARPGQESRHNVLYWRYGEYAGIGPGAHGRLIAGGTRYATSTEKSPEGWLTRVEHDGHGLTEDAALSSSEQADEALLMGLRLTEGLPLSRIAALAGLAPSDKVIGHLEAEGLIERTGTDRLRATPRGRFILNALVLELSAGLAPV
jgi:oxygen-independent coproporphyrinogen-3 oxidase